MRSFLILVSLVLTAVSALAQEKIAFKVQYKEGDAIDVRECTKMRLSGVIQGQEMSIKQEGTKEYREKALAVTDGLPVRAERTYKTYEETQEQRMGTMPAQGGEKKNAIVGKPVILARKDGRVQLEAKPEAGELDDDNLDLGTEDFDVMLPAEPVAVGEQWKVSRDKMVRVMGKETPKELETTCTLEEVTEKDGAKVARIAVKVTMKGEQDGAQVSCELAGPLLFDLSAGRALSITLKGTMKMTALGATFEGPMELESTVTRVK